MSGRDTPADGLILASHLLLYVACQADLGGFGGARIASDGRLLNLRSFPGSMPEHVAGFVLGPHGTDIWWPQVDEGHYLPNMLEGRTGNDKWMERLHRKGVAA